MKLLIIGAGGYGRLVKEIALLNGYDTVDFADDNSELAIVKLNNIQNVESHYDGSVVAIGNPEIKKNLFNKLKNPVTLIHPMASVSSSACIEKGCVIEAFAVINSEAVIENGTFICAGAVVNHNSMVREFSQIDCNAVVASGAKVPNGTKVKSCTVWER